MLSSRFFQKNKKFFTVSEGFCIAEVASDRSGNERAVKHVKLSSFLSDGLHHYQSFVRVNEVWTAFDFQINFMHCTVV